MHKRLALFTISGSNILIDFLYPLAVLQLLGAGAESDCFFFFAALNTFFLVIFVQPIAGVVTTRLATSRSPAEWRLLAWSGHFGAACIYGAVALLLLLTADAWLGALMPRTGNLALYRELLVWQAAALLLAGTHTSAAAAVQSRKQFVTAELTVLLCALAFYFPFRHMLAAHGVVAATVVMVVRGVVQLALLLLFSGRPVWRGVPAVVKDFFWQFRWPVLGSIYCKTDTMLDRYLLGQGRDGLLSVYHLAQQLLGIVSGLYSKTFIPPLRVAAAEDVANGELAALRRRVLRHVALAAMIAAGCLLAAMLASWAPQPLAAALGVGPALVADAAVLVMALTGATLGGQAGMAINAVFYALGRQGTAVLVSVVNYTLFLPLKILIFHAFGIRGLALVASLHFLVGAGALLVLLARALREQPRPERP
jgi:hypothetical protein